MLKKTKRQWLINECTLFEKTTFATLLSRSHYQSKVKS